MQRADEDLLCLIRPPGLEVIYVYSQPDGTLDLNVRGARTAVEALRGLFAAGPSIAADGT